MYQKTVPEGMKGYNLTSEPQTLETDKTAFILIY